MEPHEVMRRVGLALLIFFAIHAVGGVADFVTGSSHSFTIDLTALILGILLRRGSLGAARWTSFLYSFQLVSIAVCMVIGLPIGLWVAREQLGAMPVLAIVWSLLCTVAEGVFAWWVVRELRDPAVETLLAKGGRGSNRRASWWGGSVAVGMVAILGAIGLFVYSMWPRWTAPAVAVAHAQLGDDWQVSVQQMSTSSSGWHAHVVARKGDQVKELDLQGE
jgi:hypothetical protein